jgi:threonine synthase
LREIAKDRSVTLVNSVNPYRLEGQKTAAFEICDQLDNYPDVHAMPVGNAGNISAYWMGYKEYRAKGEIKALPVMLGFQAEGAAPIVLGRIVPDPKTVATAIKIGNPASWKMALAARDESGGRIEAVSDKDILASYQLLAAKEGVFVEPASAAGVAGILRLAKRGYFKDFVKKNKRKAIVVCVLTGHGLKDPDRAIASVKKLKAIPAKLDAIMKAIQG